jgi:hypothetical protein
VPAPLFLFFEELQTMGRGVKSRRFKSFELLDRRFQMPLPMLALARVEGLQMFGSQSHLAQSDSPNSARSPFQAMGREMPIGQSGRTFKLGQDGARAGSKVTQNGGPELRITASQNEQMPAVQDWHRVTSIVCKYGSGCHSQWCQEGRS